MSIRTSWSLLQVSNEESEENNEETERPISCGVEVTWLVKVLNKLDQVVAACGHHAWSALLALGRNDPGQAPVPKMDAALTTTFNGLLHSLCESLPIATA